MTPRQSKTQHFRARSAASARHSEKHRSFWLVLPYLAIGAWAIWHLARILAP